MPLNVHAIGKRVRDAGLMPAAYRTAMRIDMARHAVGNRRFKRSHPGLAVPSAEFRFETQNTTDLLRFDLGGQERAQYILRTAVEHLSSETLRILEWGCGPARVVRHLPNLDTSRTVEAFGTDYSGRLIDWCQANVPDVTFAKNALEPPLPFEDASFDMVYSFSVFTHLSPEVQKRWIDEHLRVLRPGGILLFTVHGEAYRVRLVGDELREYDNEGVVVRGDFDEGGTWYTTYQHPAQVERDLIPGLEVVHRNLAREGDGLAQDVWVVRRPETD